MRLLCVGHLIVRIASAINDRLLQETDLRQAITEYVRHDHEERNRQGIDNALIAASVAVNANGKVVRRERLGGLLGFYYREAA